MSWCDKLASTASVGFRLSYHFASADAVIEALSPVLDKLVDGDKTRFAMNEGDPLGALAPFNVSFTNDEGFQYGVEPSKVFVSFKHRVKVRAVSGGPPTMEMLSHPLPFTKLLPKVSEKVIEATLLLPKAASRTVTRLGIISTTQVASDELPPGIARFIKYVGRPWKAAPEHFNITLMSELASAPGWSDRCIHTVTKPEDQEELLTLNFDWQRTFASGRTIAQNVLNDILRDAERTALSYFEDLAEGSRFDEELIRTAERV